MKKLGLGSGIARAGCVIALGTALLFLTSITLAQESPTNELNLTFEPGNHAATGGAQMIYRHSHPANTSAGRSLRAKEIAASKQIGKNTDGGGGGILQYEGDLTYQGGSVVDFAQFHAIYLLPNGKCPISACWGNPEGFLKDLGKSDFIHLADQYIGFFGGDRYTLGFHAKLSYTPPSAPLTDADMQEVVYLVASLSGDTGYNHIYHIFLPPGQDQCFDSTDTECYSPDNFNTFFYCGYHSSVTFTDIGHVLYTVEPYQDVVGCQVKPGSPNGQMVDSTDNVLNHESFETITDPDGTAWINTTLIAMFLDEVGDECSFETVVGENAYFNPPFFSINRHDYGVQSIYSNSLHACGTAP